MRRLLEALLVRDAELDAYCIDYFPGVYKSFTNGMERTQKVNLLLVAGELEEIVRNLQLFAPDKFDTSYDIVIKSMQPTPAGTDLRSKMLRDILDSRGPGNRDAPGPVPDGQHLPPDRFAVMEARAQQLFGTLPMAPGIDEFVGQPAALADQPPIRIYRVSSGTYRAKSIEIRENSYDPALSELLVPGYACAVFNDGQGNITIMASDGSLPLGSGAVRRNRGLLTADKLQFHNKVESWQSRRTVELVVVGDDQLQIEVCDYRTNRRNSGFFGHPLRDCTIRFAALLQR